MTWPIIPIHIALLPDGRVLSYGTDQNGLAQAQFNYDIWDPTLGIDSSSHLVLPNTTATNIFCSNQALMWTNGALLVTGGSLGKNEGLIHGQTATTVFTPQSNSVTSSTPMNFPRWYDTLVALPSGEMLALGGREGGVGPTLIPSMTPEIFNAASGWRTLPGATSTEAFFNKYDWYYPRAFLAPNGRVFVINNDGVLEWLDTTGAGAIWPAGMAPGSGGPTLPNVLYQPGKILSLRAYGQAVTIDINGPTPVVTPAASLSQIRSWASGTVLPDGEVLVTGGSTVSNQLAGAAMQTEVWNPYNGTWTLGAVASKPRLYHSNALLLLDGSVLTGGGGSPGPVINLNAEVYYPRYLFRHDGSGQPAPRPSLAVASPLATIGQTVTAQAWPAGQIARMTLIKAGSSTHSVNTDQRFMELSFTQDGLGGVVATLPSNPNVLMPGYYMLFALDWSGVPSFGSMILILPSAATAAATQQVATVGR